MAKPKRQVGQRSATEPSASEATIFSRILENANGPLDRRLACYLVSLEFSEQDKSRMHELAVKNQSGKLGSSEQVDLDNYLRVSDILAVLQSKARQALNQIA